VTVPVSATGGDAFEPASMPRKMPRMRN
jgi:hypothetical protein